MSKRQETRECPFCKEAIKADAIKCKHCGSRVAPEEPTHGGTCPYCKEEIRPDAIKCKHCGSYVGPVQGVFGRPVSGDCGDCGDQGVATLAMQEQPGGTGLPERPSGCAFTWYLACMSAPPPGYGSNWLSTFNRDPFQCWMVARAMCGEVPDPGRPPPIFF